MENAADMCLRVWLIINKYWLNWLGTFRLVDQDLQYHIDWPQWLYIGSLIIMQSVAWPYFWRVSGSNKPVHWPKMAKLLTALLTHWGRVTHICVSKLTINGSDNGLSPGRRQAIIWTNAGILLIQTLGTNFSEILREIYTFSFRKIHLKLPYGKCRPSCLGLNVLMNGNLCLNSLWHGDGIYHHKTWPHRFRQWFLISLAWKKASWHNLFNFGSIIFLS